LKWTPLYGYGDFMAEATLIYDGESKTEKAEFKVGETNINIGSISVDKFNLGGIAKFDIMLESQWNKMIEDVKAIVDVMQGTKIYTSSRTETVNLEPYEKQQVSAYWDTDKVIPGKYEMKVSLFYLGTVDEKFFDILVEQDKITTTPVGQVIQTNDGEESSTILNSIYLLILLVIILIGINVFIYLKKLRPKKQND